MVDCAFLHAREVVSGGFENETSGDKLGGDLEDTTYGRSEAR